MHDSQKPWDTGVPRHLEPRLYWRRPAAIYPTRPDCRSIAPALSQSPMHKRLLRCNRQFELIILQLFSNSEASRCEVANPEVYVSSVFVFSRSHNTWIVAVPASPTAAVSGRQMSRYHIYSSPSVRVSITAKQITSLVPDSTASVLFSLDSYLRFDVLTAVTKNSTIS
jgi:hypothetical protein